MNCYVSALKIYESINMSADVQKVKECIREIYSYYKEDVNEKKQQAERSRAAEEKRLSEKERSRQRDQYSKLNDDYYIRKKNGQKNRYQTGLQSSDTHLHEVIVSVLNKYGRNLSNQEIANIINENGLYFKGDGSLVKANQVAARRSKYGI